MILKMNQKYMTGRKTQQIEKFLINSGLHTKGRIHKPWVLLFLPPKYKS